MARKRSTLHSSDYFHWSLDSRTRPSEQSVLVSVLWGEDIQESSRKDITKFKFLEVIWENKMPSRVQRLERM